MCPPPWTNGNDEVVHPDAPAGGGGCGAFRGCGPTARDTNTEVPHPHSPAARYWVLDDDQKRRLRHRAAPLQVADAGDDLNMEVRNNALRMVGKKVVGDGECYAMADKVLRDASAKSAPDFGKVTKSKNDNYKWGTPIDLKDVKPGDILQFRDHEIDIVTVTKIKKGPNSTSAPPGGTTEQTLSRGQHTAVVVSDEGDGVLIVVEQHVLDHSTNKLSTTVRKNTLYTKDVPATTRTKHSMEGNVEETTVTITVKGTIWAYRPQGKEN